MTDAEDSHICTIGSATDLAGNAACRLDWGPVQALLTPKVTLNTARTLMAAAAHAETDIALLDWCRKTLKADHNTAGHILLDVRAERPAPDIKTALRIASVAGAKTGLPYVHIARGSMKGELSPDEARQMATHWTEAATAAQIDVRLRYTLDGHPLLAPADVDQIFAQLRGLVR
ncbi:hypothetical protein [Streptomyces sp. AK08-02]|uniref:hypothetical protein n=1 Tax=Streptomyces sp. AK08-02 TaxID=3028654 RepID=UPI0029B131F6|nr:hypothetical protein [Streptomyces sp. AK08-02]MDX3748714.1 hypothetical protein [Streptomyces sp. AK08-02]